MIMPGRYSEQGLENVILPIGFEVHLTPVEQPGRELVYPAGIWFQPPPDHYRIWLEGEDRMSPHSSLMLYSGGRFKSRGIAAILAVTDAGRVRLREGLELRPDWDLRLLHAAPYRPGRHELSRAAPAIEARDGLQMPAGPTIAGLWDHVLQRYVALSRPFQVPAGAMIDAPLEIPTTEAHLVVQLRRKGGGVIDDEATFFVAIGDRRIEPETVVRTSFIVYGFWYDLPSGRATLHAGSNELYLEPQPFILRRGEGYRIVGEMEPRPF